MNNWLVFLMIVIPIIIIIGNFSTFQKSSKQKMREKSLNDLQETLPRTNKHTHKMDTINKQNSSKKL